MSPEPYLVLAGLLFSIGAVGVLVRRNAIVVFMCVELMLNACNLTLVTFARQHGNLDGQVARLLRDGGGRGRGRGRARDHHDDLPYSPLGFGRRRQPPEVLRAEAMDSLLFLIIAIPAASAAILLLGGKYTDAWGHYLGVLAPIASFVLGVAAFIDLKGEQRRSAAPAPVRLDPRRRLQRRDGAAVRPPDGAVRAAHHRRRQPDPHLLARLHGARRSASAILRVPQPVRRGDVDAGDGDRLPDPVPRLGRRRPGVVPADRVLAAQGLRGRRRQEGVRGEPRR